MLLIIKNINSVKSNLNNRAYVDKNNDITNAVSYIKDKNVNTNFKSFDFVLNENSNCKYVNNVTTNTINTTDSFESYLNEVFENNFKGQLYANDGNDETDNEWIKAIGEGIAVGCEDYSSGDDFAQPQYDEAKTSNREVSI